VVVVVYVALDLTCVVALWRQVYFEFARAGKFELVEPGRRGLEKLQKVQDEKKQRKIW